MATMVILTIISSPLSHIHKLAFTRFEAHHSVSSQHSKVVTAVAAAAVAFTIFLKQEMRCNAINYGHYYLFTCSINLLHEWRIPKPTDTQSTDRPIMRAGIHRCSVLTDERSK